MECSTWSGAESFNLQFMVPKVSADQQPISLYSIHKLRSMHVNRTKSIIAKSGDIIFIAFFDNGAVFN